MALNCSGGTDEDDDDEDEEEEGVDGVLIFGVDGWMRLGRSARSLRLDGSVWHGTRTFDGRVLENTCRAGDPGAVLYTIVLYLS